MYTRGRTKAPRERPAPLKKSASPPEAAAGGRRRGWAILRAPNEANLRHWYLVHLV